MKIKWRRGCGRLCRWNIKKVLKFMNKHIKKVLKITENQGKSVKKRKKLMFLMPNRGFF